ncbi:MAG: non-canonical purine NTP pyrophosphatase [Planctomycetes bacterium]|nr:non-canonical purine NTP pyrophosphatase [Planctomycetota bacterium]MBL7044433.1 non-canonical purine NTP pyrophosphatase [Pirellulaceae bacterium]
MKGPNTLVLGTRNPGKVAEFRALLADCGWQIADLSDFHNLHEVEEEGSTLAENARAKAAGFSSQIGQWVLADDTGLMVDALDGAPGARTARFAGPGATAKDNRERLLAELGTLPAEKRTASFVCHLALADPAGRILAEADGKCRGRIRFEPVGDRGFGYDCLFEIAEYHRTLAELGETATVCLSHRARAVRSLQPTLLRLAEK